MIFALAALMAIDFLTGLSKAWKIKDPITSHKISEGLMKKLHMILIVAIIGICLWGLGIDYSPALNFLFPILMTAELYSPLPNIHAFRTGEVLPEYDVISILLKKIGQSVVDAQNSFLKKGAEVISVLFGSKK